MSAGAAAPGEGEESDFELNLAPIIDCFTVLITYLLATASFLSVNMLDVNVATTSDQAPPPEQLLEPVDTLSVEVSAAHELTLVVTGKQNARIRVPAAAAGDWDIDQMADKLGKIKERLPQLAEVSVRPEPGIPYKQVVRVIDSVKKTIPKVFLGE